MRNIRRIRKRKRPRDPTDLDWCPGGGERISTDKYAFLRLGWDGRLLRTGKKIRCKVCNRRLEPWSNWFALWPTEFLGWYLPSHKKKGS